MAQLLLATGLNTHGQLDPSSVGIDIATPTPLTIPSSSGKSTRSTRSGAISGTTDCTLFHASWSSTALAHTTSNQITSLGNQNCTITPEIPPAELLEPFGDHDGLTGCLSTDGRLWLLDPVSLESDAGGRALRDQSDPEGSPLLGHLALASNGRVAVTFAQAPNGRLCHVLCFEGLMDLLAWYRDPSGVRYDAETQHTMMQGQPRQLVAGTGVFVLRMEGGEVYSWGDARYRSLGRELGEAGAEKPGVVEALWGVKMAKVAVGGWMGAAVSGDGACYLWGAGTPGTDQTIRCLREAGAGEVVLVELPGEGEGAEPLDVVDVAVGDNHVVILAEGNRCFVAGECHGLGGKQNWLDDWTPLNIGDHSIRSVACGPQSIFLQTS